MSVFGAFVATGTVALDIGQVRTDAPNGSNAIQFTDADAVSLTLSNLAIFAGVGGSLSAASSTATVVDGTLGFSGSITGNVLLVSIQDGDNVYIGLQTDPDALSADGTPIDLRLVETPAYVQAGREDHIAPPDSVLRLLDVLAGPARFVLAGSGHIAGVVNPPAANKYGYWTGGPTGSLEAFLAGAEQHPGSWWTDWLAWLEGLSAKRVPARGKRAPGGKGDKVIEDAPGRYVATR